MALLGDLETFALCDVLRLLAATAKTGCLHVEGDLGQGEVWLRDGALTSARTSTSLDDTVIDEVVFGLLRFERGTFKFHVDEPPPAHEHPGYLTDIESVLRAARRMLDEWRDLQSVVPSPDHEVALQPELPLHEVTIDTSAWSTLAAVGTGATVSELAERLGLSEIDTMRRIRDVVDDGLVIVGPPAGASRPPRARRTPDPALADTHNGS